MYIQMVQGACGRQQDMHRVVDAWCSDMATRPGWLGGTFGFDDDGAFHGIVRFESEDACRENGDREESAWWWAAAAECFDGEPTIHASSEVMMMLDGGSDDAGFVQIMRGRIADPTLVRGMTSDGTMTMLHQARPEIIGATLAIEDDGTFTETVSFTSEREARRGESAQMPAEMAERMNTAFAEVSFTDLHQPWFGSHS